MANCRSSSPDATSIVKSRFSVEPKRCVFKEIGPPNLCAILKTAPASLTWKGLVGDFGQSSAYELYFKVTVPGAIFCKAIVSLSNTINNACVNEPCCKYFIL